MTVRQLQPVLHQLGIPRDICEIELRFRAKDIIDLDAAVMSLWPCRCHGV